MRKIKDILSSVKLTIVILLVLASLSVLGTIIPQGAPIHQYIKAYGPKLSKIITYLQLNDMYHSHWFRLLLLIFSINLVLCSIRRIPHVLESIKRKKLLSAQEIKKLPNHIVIPEKRFREILKEFGKPELEDNGKCIFEKGRIGPLGPYITHFGIIIILIGGLVGSFLGFRGTTEIPEGGCSSQITVRKGGKIFQINLPFTIRCLSFSVEFYPGSNVPKDYRSLVEVVSKDGSILKRGIIRVNHPLKVMGYTIYQASYGLYPSGKLTLKVLGKNGETIKTIKVSIGDRVKISKDAEIRVVSFKPNLQGFGEAAHIIYYKSGVPLTAFWIFKRFPKFDMERKSDYHFVLEGAELKYYTGLEVSKSPGVLLVWIGSVIMVLGIFISFFIPHRRIWSAAEKGKVYIGGVSTKNQESLDETLLKLKGEI